MLLHGPTTTNFYKGHTKGTQSYINKATSDLGDEIRLIYDLKNMRWLVINMESIFNMPPSFRIYIKTIFWKVTAIGGIANRVWHEIAINYRITPSWIAGSYVMRNVYVFYDGKRCEQKDNIKHNTISTLSSTCYHKDEYPTIQDSSHVHIIGYT